MFIKLKEKRVCSEFGHVLSWTEQTLLAGGQVESFESKISPKEMTVQETPHLDHCRLVRPSLHCRIQS